MMVCDGKHSMTLPRPPREYARRQDGRRNGLFSVACRLARYAAHGVISEHEFRNQLHQARTPMVH